MPTPISYLSGNTLSYQSGMVKKGTIGLNLSSSLIGNYRWWNGVDVTSSQYLIYSDTYSTGASSEASVTPAAWSTPDLTDQSLLNLINTLPDRVGQTAFTTLSNALIWLNESGKYFVVRNGYENIVTSGLTLNLDAAWYNSFTTGSTFWYDLSGTGNTGTLTNGPSFTTQDGGAIVFDGTNDVVRVSQQGNSLKPTNFTTEAWVKLNSSQSSRVFIATFSESQSGIGMGLCDPDLGPRTNNTIKFFTSGDNSAGYDHIYSTIQLNVGQWYHVTCTYDGSFKRIYINGVLNNYSAYTQAIGYINNDFTVGGLDYSGNIIQSFDGNIAYARMYNRALSQSEILQNYHVTKQRFGFNNIVGNGLVLNLNSQNLISYPTSGTSWYDLTGNNNTGTLTNGPTFDSTTRSVVFDGSDDRVNLGDIMPINQYTKCVLFNISNISSVNNLISGGGNGTHYFYPASSNYLRAGHFQEGAELVSNTPIVANKWYHGVLTFSTSSGFVMYQNAVNVGTNSSKAPFVGGNVVYLGSYAESYLLNGKIANAQIYNRVLTPTEVLQNYYQGNIVTNGLVLNLDVGNLVSYGGTGTSWEDLTSTTTGATLVNGPTYSTTNGGSIVFDGLNDYCGVTNDNLKPTNGITQECWFKSNKITGAQVFIGRQYGNSSNNSYALWWGEGGNNSWNAGINIGGGFFYMTAYLTWESNKWYHFVHTYNGSVQKMYVNGIEIGSENRSGTILYDDNNVVTTIGCDFNGGGYNTGIVAPTDGNISNVKIYNRALTQSEIIQNFNAHKSRYGL